MKMLWSRQLLWLVPAGAIAAVAPWYPHGKSQSAEVKVDAPLELAQSSEPETGVRVTVVSPRKGGLPRVTSLPCAAHWFESADLFAKTPGYLKTQNVDIGSKVKQGEVVAQLDSPELDRDVDLMRA